MPAATFTVARQPNASLPRETLRQYCVGSESAGVRGASIVTAYVSFGTGNYPAGGWNIDFSSSGLCSQYFIPLERVVIVPKGNQSGVFYVGLWTPTGGTTLNLKLFRKSASSNELEELPNDSVDVNTCAAYVTAICDFPVVG